MKIFTVILRELRSQARQASTYGLRAGAVLLLLLAAWLFVADQMLDARLGPRLFCRLHLMLQIAIWVLVPLGAADCISRERREGTLGLLFLTPLRSQHIVIAKSITHGLRALTLLLACVPVLTIPFIVGGISGVQTLVSVLVNLTAVTWSLAAAVVASALARRLSRALAGAMIFTAGGGALAAYAFGAMLGANLTNTWMGGYAQPTYDLLLGGGVFLMQGADWAGFLRVFTPGQILFTASCSLLLGGLALCLAISFAGWRIRQSWQEEPPSARLQQVQQTFCEPRFAVSWLRRWMQRTLTRNPVGWLEVRRWSGRLVTWAWFAIIISIFSAALTDRNFLRGEFDIPIYLGWLVTVSIAVSAAGSFRRERETGVLELLLVSPLKSTEIINGRLAALWIQFAPATVMLLAVWAYLESILPWRDPARLGWVWFFAVTFAVTPIAGLYFSVRCRNFLTALLLTVGVTLLLPALLHLSLSALAWAAQPDGAPWRWAETWATSQWFIQLSIAGFLYFRLHRQLEQRAFPLERAVN